MKLQQLQRRASTSYRRPQAARTLVVAAASDGPMKVVVTGAAGRTGGLITKKLAERPAQFQTRAVVRSEKSKNKVTQLGVPESQTFCVNVSDAQPGAFAAAFAGCDALVIATSAVPKIKPLSLIPVILAKIFRKEGVRPEFSWVEDQTPQQVDWLGQKAQIDAAKAAGVRRVLIIGSMGGTQPDNMLNKLGDGNILFWKRKAEQYLIASGLTYTIIHPGGLIDEAGGDRELVLGVDDELLKRKARQIPRGDVAELAVRCLGIKAAENRSFDVVSLPRGEGSPTRDFDALLAGLQGTCDYSINDQMASASVTA